MSHELYEGWDVSLATNHSILVAIQITFRIQKIFNGIFTLQERSSSAMLEDQLPWQSPSASGCILLLPLLLLLYFFTLGIKDPEGFGKN